MVRNKKTGPSVAIIGSFKKHMKQIRGVCGVFEQAGITVLSPIDTEVLRPNIPFVRLSKDDPKKSDPMVQATALHRILKADAVYVVLPKGYIGRTTCYEVGRVIQAGHPIYFSSQPEDLPVKVPASHIVDAIGLAKRIVSEHVDLESPFASGTDQYSELERRLTNEDYI